MNKREIIQDLKILIKNAKKLESIKWNAGDIEQMKYYSGQHQAYEEILKRIESRRY